MASLQDKVVNHLLLAVFAKRPAAPFSTGHANQINFYFANCKSKQEHKIFMQLE